MRSSVTEVYWPTTVPRTKWIDVNKNSSSTFAYSNGCFASSFRQRKLNGRNILLPFDIKEKLPWTTFLRSRQSYIRPLEITNWFNWGKLAAHWVPSGPVNYFLIVPKRIYEYISPRATNSLNKKSPRREMASRERRLAVLHLQLLLLDCSLLQASPPRIEHTRKCWLYNG